MSLIVEPLAEMAEIPKARTEAQAEAWARRQPNVTILQEGRIRRVKLRPVHVRKVRRTAPTLRNAIGFIILLFIGRTATAQGQQAYQGIQEKLPIEVAPQPVPFSHRQHVAAALACQDCHANAAKKERAGLPDAEKCMLCHATIKTDSPEVRKLAQIHKDGKKLDWVRVYRVPDFVFFSHANHVNANVACASCHGPVAERDVLAKEISTSMISCMNCHVESKASITCYLCHELGQ